MPNDPVLNIQGSVTVNVISSVTQTVQADICNGETYTLPNGNTATVSGVYNDTLQTVNGCDSIIITNLVVHSAFSNSVNVEICNGETYTLPNGSTATVSGIYNDTLQTVNSCDSIIITNLVVNSMFSNTVNGEICNGETYTLPNGNTTTVAGVYNDTLQTANGCDSVIITNLVVHPDYSDTINTSICNGGIYTLPDGNTATASGIYVASLQTVNGCDSLVTVDLTVYPSYQTEMNDTICSYEFYTLPDGSTVNQSGTYTVLLHTIHGCDSIVTVHLEVIHIDLSIEKTDVKCYGENSGSITVINTGGIEPFLYNWNDANYNGHTLNDIYSGTYSVTVTDAFGCSATIQETVIQPPLLSAVVNATDISCYGNIDGFLDIEPSGWTGSYNIKVNGETINPQSALSNLAQGNYTVEVTDANGCSYSEEISIIQPDSILLFTNPEIIEIILGDTLNLELSSNYDPYADYILNGINKISCNDCPNPQIIIYDSDSLAVGISYNSLTQLSVTCSIAYSLFLEVIKKTNLFVPNAFSPNADGSNDTYSIFGNLKGLRHFHFIIFNRWGEKVFESATPYFQWDGTYKNKIVEAGVLVYHIKYAWWGEGEGETILEKKGSITVVK